MDKDILTLQVLNATKSHQQGKVKRVSNVNYSSSFDDLAKEHEILTGHKYKYDINGEALDPKERRLNRQKNKKVEEQKTQTDEDEEKHPVRYMNYFSTIRRKKQKGLV